MIKTLTRGKGLLTTMALSLGLLFLLACASEDPAPTGAVASAGQPAGTQTGNGNSSAAQPNIARANSFSENGSSLPLRFAIADSANTGISVTGRGKATAKPDLATLNLGVESFASTVAAARSEAAGAMEGVVQVLHANGIPDPDIQTRHFNIHPRYTSRKVNRCVDGGGCFEEREQVIIGYQVTNQLTVKVRDLDNVGTVIDQVTGAAGNLIRFQSVNFTIEDTQVLEVEARTAAAADLMATAEQIATLTGVVLGKPVFISEVSAFTPKPLAFRNQAMQVFDAEAVTPIMTGELDVVVTLQAVFAIQ